MGSKKKIAIYTIQSMNYGNRLQNYALQETLKKLGFDVYTLKTKRVFETLRLLPLFRWVFDVLCRVKCLLRNAIKKDSTAHFYVFNKAIRYSSYYITPCFISNNIAKKFDFFVCGSDQIWNVEFPFVTLNSFLPFNCSNKIAYAPSFGTADLFEGDLDSISKCLCDFKHLSCREEAGSQIIKKLTGRQVETLIDPTLLLSKEEWMKVSKRPRRVIKEKYILIYFLSPKCKEATEEIENNQKYKLIDIFDEKCPYTKGIGPSEFIYLLSNASLVLTDSFHACVFSFIFSKPFIVYNRNFKEGSSMNSRIDTFLKKFCLDRKHFESAENNDVFENDYKESYQILDKERKKALNYLKKALSVK